MPWIASILKTGARALLKRRVVALFKLWPYGLEDSRLSGNGDQSRQIEMRIVHAANSFSKG
jgi:hypothetical protein